MATYEIADCTRYIPYPINVRPILGGPCAAVMPCVSAFGAASHCMKSAGMMMPMYADWVEAAQPGMVAGDSA
jgi:hypothetical protein